MNESKHGADLTGVVTDTDRCVLLAAEGAAQWIRTFIDYAPISTIAREVLRHKLSLVEVGLDARRSHVDVSPQPLPPLPHTLTVEIERPREILRRDREEAVA